MNKILFLTVDGTHQDIIKHLLGFTKEIVLVSMLKHKPKVGKRFKTLLQDDRLKLIYATSYFDYFLKSFKFSKNIDIVLCNCPISGFFAVLSSFKRKYFLMCQDYIEYLEVSKIKLKFLYSIIYKILLNIICRYSKVIAISKYVSDRARAYGAKNISIVPIYGINTDLFYPRKSNLRGKFNLIGRKVLLASSRLSYEKGLNYLLASFKEITNSFPNISLVIVGTGPLESELKKQAVELGIEKQVIFIGLVDFENMPDYYNLCDIFIIPSLREGLGLSVLEAMACEKPVIASAVGGLKETVINNKTGISISPASPNEISSAVKILLSDEKLYKQLVKNAKEMVLNNYEFKIVNKKLESALK